MQRVRLRTENWDISPKSAKDLLGGSTDHFFLGLEDAVVGDVCVGVGAWRGSLSVCFVWQAVYLWMRLGEVMMLLSSVLLAGLPTPICILYIYVCCEKNIVCDRERSLSY
jgi:hypothetical protein